LEHIPREVKKPLLVNMLSGGVTPILSVDELGKLGYKIVVCPIESLLVTATAVQKLIQSLLTRGRVDLPPNEMMTFAEVKKILGLDDVMGLRDKLSPQ
jgi:methylisocitrate lyase